MICGLIYQASQIKDHLAEIWVNDVCYEVETPMADQVTGGTDAKKQRMYIYHHINERGQRLYGFETPEAKQLFIDLISVENIGPAKAIKILSSMEPEKVMAHLADGDIDALAEAQGIGKKSAEKLVADLQKKYEPRYSSKRDLGTLSYFDLTKALRSTGGYGAVFSGLTPEAQEKMRDTGEAAMLALVKLGYKKQAAIDVLKTYNYSWLTTNNPDFNGINFNELLSTLIKYGLSKLNSGAA
jgi:Holliday junction DNA helicase RuvA